MTDPLPTETQLLELLIASAYANYCSSLIGGPPVSHERFKFFNEFKAGDLVMEVSSLHRRDYDAHRIGHLVSNQMEPYGTDEWWEENKEDYEGKRPEERVYTIKRLIGGENFRWTNAMMVRVVTERAGQFP